MATDLDVLVVGGGPVGLFAAHELCRNGVSPKRVRIIDKRATQKMWCKAVGLHTRSREIFYASSQDLSDGFEENSAKVDRIQISQYKPGQTFEENETIMVGHFGNVQSQFNKMAVIEQYTTENLIAKDLKDKFGVTLERGIQLVGFEDKGSFVEVQITKTPPKNKENDEKQSDESVQTLRVKYLLGCDGARSFVRSQLNLPFVGETYEENFIAFHGTLNGTENFPFPSVTWQPGPNGFLFMITLKDRSFYLVINFDEAQSAKMKQVNGRIVPTKEDVDNALATRGMKGLSVKDTKWLSGFNIDSKQITQYSKGRVYLAGDACHVHSPVGGQGMNMGLQDAQNLVWKLALVINKRCSASLLTTYNTERYNVDGVVLKEVDRGTKAGLIRNKFGLFLTKTMQKSIGQFQFLVDANLATTSQITYSYKKYSELSWEYWKPPSFFPYVLYRRQQNITRIFRRRLVAGDRMPDFVVPDGNEEGYVHQRLYSLFRDSNKPFVIVLFEGNKDFECPHSDYTDLSVFKAEIEKSECGAYVKVIMVTSVHQKLNDMFGVYQQCMFLVRPDCYIGLRSQPFSMDALKYYLAKKMCANDVRIGDEEVQRVKDIEKVNPLPGIKFKIMVASFVIGLSYYIGNKVLPNQYKPRDVVGRILNTLSNKLSK